MTAPDPETIRVVLVDDHPVVADGVRMMLAAESGIDVVGVTTSAAGADELIERERPDVVVCDIEIGPDSGFDILLRHRDERRGAMAVRPAFVMFSAFDRRSYLQQSFQDGAHGYVVKGASGSELVAAVRSAAAGDYRFGADVMRAVRDRVRRPSDRLLEVVGLMPSAERTMRWPTSSRSARRPSRATFGHCSLAVREGWIQSGIVGRQS